MNRPLGLTRLFRTPRRMEEQEDLTPTAGMAALNHQTLVVREKITNDITSEEFKTDFGEMSVIPIAIAKDK